MKDIMSKSRQDAIVNLSTHKVGIIMCGTWQSLTLLMFMRTKIKHLHSFI